MTQTLVLVNEQLVSHVNKFKTLVSFSLINILCVEMGSKEVDYGAEVVLKVSVGVFIPENLILTAV